jgi:alginate production protein
MGRLRIALLSALLGIAAAVGPDAGRAGEASSSGGPIDRPQDRRTAEPLTLRVFGRPLRIRGELDLGFRYEGNLSLEGAAQDSEVRLGPELSIDLTYTLAEDALLFAELIGFLDAEHASGDGRPHFDGALELGQAFLDVGDLLGGAFSLRIGRQAVFEERNWWWDADLDAVRLFYDRGPLRAELAVAWQLTRLSTDWGRDPEESGVLRGLGHLEWRFAEGHWLEAFLLLHDDSSSRQDAGRRLRAGREDPSDADLTWLGARASGERDFERLGELEYFLEGAWVGGRETRVAVDEEASLVASRRARAVRGFALMAGLSWEVPLPFEPTLTVEYALGSGDRDSAEETDRAFRQTGLQSNEGRFDGVGYFDYYGALLRPELSNLQIFTVGVGVPLLRSSSLDLVYHLYRQVRPAPALRGARLEAEPDGNSPEIGQALDLVIGLREWKQVEVEVVASVFRAGDAFGSRAGRVAFGLSFELELEF